MKSKSDSTRSTTTINPLGQPGFEYTQQLWGDLIYGTKEQLQGIGIGAGMPFPGEFDGPKRSMTVTDPRGFPCNIERSSYKGDGIFVASISFPGRNGKWDEQWVYFADGVHKCIDLNDEYIGTADALHKAGIVSPDHLPGQLGMRKIKVTIFPDGTVPKGAPTANWSEAKNPGAKWIKRASKTTFRVTVVVSEEEWKRRFDMHQRRGNEWDARMLALPRPAPLIDLREEETDAEPKLPKYRTVGNVIYLQQRT